MARPPNADGAKTQRRILDAAIARFGAQGVHNTSLRVIAADAGVTFATVHHYFGSKAELFDRCLEASYAELAAQRDGLLASLGTPGKEVATRVRALAETAFDLAHEHATVSRFLLRATIYENEDNPRGRAAQGLYLDVASAILGPVVGRTPESLRVPLQGFMFLLTRSAIVSRRELEVVAGRAPLDATTAELRTYLGDVAVATLLPALDTNEKELRP